MKLLLLLLLALPLALAQDFFINCGGTRDSRFVQDLSLTRAVAAANEPIAGATSQYLYQNHRSPSASASSLTYTLPRRAPGLYLVELAFAEIANSPAKCARGARAFNVAINSVAVLANFDVFATAGCRRALRRRFYNVRVGPDGVLAVTLSDGAAGKSMISYINAKATGRLAPPPPPPTAASAALFTWSATAAIDVSPGQNSQAASAAASVADTDSASVSVSAFASSGSS